MLAINEEQEFQDVIKVIADEAKKLLDATDCTIYMADNYEELLKPIYTNDPQYKEELMSYELDFGEGITGKAAVSQKCEYLNYDKKKRETTSIPGTNIEEDEPESIVAVPMMDGDELLGIISVGKQRSRITKKDIERLKLLTRQAEIAIRQAENLKKIKESRIRLKENKEKIERLHKFAAELEACHDKNEIYDATIEASEDILDFGMCSIDAVEGERFVVKATSSDVPPNGSESTSIYEGIAGRTYLEGRSFLITEAKESEDADPVKDEYHSGIS
ncbi:MAG: GAF domain-containing protein, partial [Thermoplasmatota archaeon]